MKPVDYYAGREQTYIKHFFLERYLERVTYKIGSFAQKFVYVDGFSGPWKSADEAFEDTSFVIAVKKLREVVARLSSINRHPSVRCLFIEKDPKAFRTLQRAVEGTSDIAIELLNGEFDKLVPDITRFIGNDFALTFIDPTGWTGFGLRRIERLLRVRGEVIVNFMFDHINRFLERPGPEYAETFDELFGGAGWNDAIKPGRHREERTLALYQDRLRTIGDYEYVTSTRILKPLSDRSYFYLVYGTRHPEGILEFRSVEKKAVREQERVRLEAKQRSRVFRTGQAELFGAVDMTNGNLGFTEEKEFRLRGARERLLELLEDNERIPFEEARPRILELPLVWEADFKDLILALRHEGRLEIEGMSSRQRRPQVGHVLVRIAGKG